MLHVVHIWNSIKIWFYNKKSMRKGTGNAFCSLVFTKAKIVIYYYRFGRNETVGCTYTFHRALSQSRGGERSLHTSLAELDSHTKVWLGETTCTWLHASASSLCGPLNITSVQHARSPLEGDAICLALREGLAVPSKGQFSGRTPPAAPSEKSSPVLQVTCSEEDCRTVCHVTTYSTHCST